VRPAGRRRRRIESIPNGASSRVLRSKYWPGGRPGGGTQSLTRSLAVMQFLLLLLMLLLARPPCVAIAADRLTGRFIHPAPLHHRFPPDTFDTNCTEPTEPIYTCVYKQGGPNKRTFLRVDNSATVNGKKVSEFCIEKKYKT